MTPWIVKQMVENQILTIEGAIAHAGIMELGEIEFLNIKGHYGARGSEVKYIRLIFIDGKKCTMSHKQFMDKMSDVTFRLRPLSNNS